MSEWKEVSETCFVHRRTGKVHECTQDDCGYVCYDEDVPFCEISGLQKNILALPSENKSASEERLVFHTKKRVCEDTGDISKQEEELRDFFANVIQLSSEHSTKDLLLSRFVFRDEHVRRDKERMIRLLQNIENKEWYKISLKEEDYWIKSTLQIHENSLKIQKDNITCSHLMLGILLYAASLHGLQGQDSMFICPSEKLRMRIPTEKELGKLLNLRGKTLNNIRKFVKIHIKWDDIATPLSFSTEDDELASSRLE